MRLFTLFAIVLLAHALPLVSIGKFRKSTFFLGGLGYTCRNLAVAAALALATVPGGAMEAAIAQSATVPALAPVDYYRLSVEADHALHSGQLAQAAQLFTRLLVDHPGNGDYWEKLGTCYERLKQFPDAANAYEHAFSLAVGSRAYIENQIAEMWGDAGERAKVLEWLKRANADAFAHRSEILSDPAFAKWRDDPEFVAVAGQTRPPNLSRDQQWQFDLDYLLAEIRRLHYRYRWDELPAGLTETAASLRAQIPNLTDGQIVVRMQRMLAQLDDGHSLVYFFFGDHELKRLPVNLYFFSDGLYVMHAPSAQKDLIGCRVLKIGDLDTETILQRLAPYISRDNDNMLHAMGAYYLTTPEFLRETGAISDVNHVALTLETPSGENRTVMLEAATGGDIIKSLVAPESQTPPPLYLTRPDEAYWFAELPEAKAVYFQFHHVMNAPGESLEAFSTRLKNFLDEKRPDNLIIDVRHNNGGDAQLLPPLLRTLTQFEGSKPNAHIYVISGRTTFSACQIFIAQVEMLTHAIFVGEPSSSSANFIGEDVPVILPFSQEMVSISTGYHQGNASDPWVWIAPAIPVALSSKDYFANRDPVLEAVINVIEGK
jgi:tetratricopeptide (TPR) repeat protein